VKRLAFNWINSDTVEMVDAPYGPFVRAKDAEAEVAKLKAENERLRADVRGAVDSMKAAHDAVCEMCEWHGMRCREHESLDHDDECQECDADLSNDRAWSAMHKQMSALRALLDEEEGGGA
jgi:hypothetical protein